MVIYPKKRVNDVQAQNPVKIRENGKINIIKTESI